jgi:pterin-4a-carbinolamine dehydratase
MNTKDNLDEKKLTVDTENNEMHPEPDLQKQESVVDPPHAEQVQDAVEPANTDEAPLEDQQEKKIDYHLDDADTDEPEETDNDEDEADEESGADDTPAPLFTIEEIVHKLRALLEEERPQRKEIDEYKNQFYRSLRNEIEGQKQSFLSAGGEEIDFVASEPPLFTEGKELLQKIREKRAAILAMEEAEKEKNVARKLAIIEQIKLLTQNQGQEDFNKVYQEFKALQQEWNEIRLIPQARVNELWKSYQHYVEIFYDLVRINNEFREYDFKKNLELKTELCEAAERLNEEPDVVSAFHQLQNLHQEWREIGPVSRKDREEIWNRFKEASTSINKKYQAHFEALRSKEDENLELKTALCEKLEAIDYSQIKTIRDWNNKVKEVLEIQSQWRQIGYVPRKWNSKIYKRYRAACDFFFRSKNEFYKSLRNEMEENLRKKTALCERAEALKDSQDWKKTTQEMIEIQKEWKSIGIVPHKYVDSIWKRFISACDYFFEQKKMHTSSQYEEESRNLEAKKKIVEQINQLDPALDADEAVETLRSLMDEWYAIGHVPYKLKDRVYREFYDATEAQFDRLHIDKAERKLESFKTNIADMNRSGNAKNQLLHEREKLMRQYDRMKNELQTYENNIGFLSVSSKKGNHLVDDMNQKVERIKSELQLIVKKIDALDKEL